MTTSASGSNASLLPYGLAAALFLAIQIGVERSMGVSGPALAGW